MAYWLIGAGHQMWLRNQTSSSCGLSVTFCRWDKTVPKDVKITTVIWTISLFTAIKFTQFADPLALLVVILPLAVLVVILQAKQFTQCWPCQLIRQWRLNLKRVTTFSTFKNTPGPGCSKLTKLLVNVLLKFQMLKSEIRHHFLSKKCEQCKSFFHFFNKKFHSIW